MGKKRMYYRRLHSRYLYEVNIQATSRADADEKVKAFCAEMRKRQTEYQWDGLTVTPLVILSGRDLCQLRSTTYHTYVRASYLLRMDVEATSAADADEKVKAFYTDHRRPPARYQHGGLIATLQEFMLGPC